MHPERIPAPRLRPLYRLLALAVFAATACDKTPVPSAPTIVQPTYSLTGTVNDGAGRPIANATIAVADAAPNGNVGKSATTNASGTYTLTGLVFQGFTVVVTAAGYSSVSRGILLPSDSTTQRADFTLSVPTSVVTGTVKDAGGTAIAGAVITVTDEAPGPNAGKRATTDAAGVYRLTDLTSAATVALSAAATGYNTARSIVTLTAGNETVVSDFSLTPMVTSYVIVGTVWSAAGPPIARASVLITDGSTGLNGGRSAIADAQGRFRIDGLKFSPFNWVRASATGHSDDDKRVPMTFGIESVNTDFVLTPATYTVRGTVTTLAGSPVAGAVVAVAEPAPHPNAGRRTFTDGTGTFSLTGLSLASFTMFVTAAGFDAAYVPVPLTQGALVATVNASLTARGPTGAAQTITFNSVPLGNPGTFTSHTEAGFTVVASDAAWYGAGYGAPAPSVQFLSPGEPAVMGRLTVTGDGRPFVFSRMDIYSSVTPIPWSITGRRNGVLVFQTSVTEPMTFGRFVTVTNPQPTVLVDRLDITLANGNFSVSCPSPPCLNPMGIDNIVVSY